MSSLIFLGMPLEGTMGLFGREGGDERVKDLATHEIVNEDLG